MGCMVCYIRRMYCGTHLVLITRRSETSHLTLLLTRILWFGLFRLRLESFKFSLDLWDKPSQRFLFFFASVVTSFCPFWFFRPMVICSTSRVGAVHFVVSSGIDVVRAGDLGEGMSYIL